MKIWIDLIILHIHWLHRSEPMWLNFMMDVWTNIRFLIHFLIKVRNRFTEVQTFHELMSTCNPRRIAYCCRIKIQLCLYDRKYLHHRYWYSKQRLPSGGIFQESNPFVVGKKTDVLQFSMRSFFFQFLRTIAFIKEFIRLFELWLRLFSAWHLSLFSFIRFILCKDFFFH